MSACHLASLVLGLVLLVTPLDAQLRGTVRDPAGAPLADAVVEVWSSSPAPVGTRTDASGAFRIAAGQLRSAERLTFRRIGYQTRIVRAAQVQADSLLDITLVADPVSLAGFTVTPLPKRAPCPNREQPVARRVWERARARYSEPPEGSGYRAMMLSHRESLKDPASDPVSEDRMQPQWAFWAGERDDPYAATQTLGQRVRERGYAWALPWRLSWYRSFAEEYFAWNYAQLFAYRAHHFISDAFGELHTLSLVRSTSEEIVLAFCPTRRGPPSIEGRLRLAADTTLVEARWSYRTPKPIEDAGGEVTFRPWGGESGALPLLSAESGTFWRREAGRDRYVRYSYVFLEWEVGPPVRSWGDPSR